MPGRILIVDDNVTRRITLAARLSGAFYEIQVAGTALEALELLEHWRPGMILIADELQCMPAGRFLRRLRADSRSAEITLLVVTAPGAHMGRAGLLSAGADDVISRSEPQEVFRARMRAQERARDVVNTLRLRGHELRPGPGRTDGPFPGRLPRQFHCPRRGELAGVAPRLRGPSGLQDGVHRYRRAARGRRPRRPAGPP
ncbi:response regulator [Oceanicola sp. S124]|uniref:response regulator n=1 Tax=Oceanicola sp. S124 TaxID=1042378 RepID=UPI0002559732|nr:response regulator [Oceanicola sp. S124]